VAGVGVGETGLGVIPGCGVGLGTGVALGDGLIVGVGLGLGEAEGERDGDVFWRWGRFFIGVAPAFSIVFPVFSIPLPMVRAVAFVPFLSVFPVSLAAFFTEFSLF
jgi:hypothetical protein